ncbi:MAG: hypothetical protein IGS03_06265 [Candidatus Sericytochromatia bacterium]|nr:hypothetical protein [Candidatus Sericytochromatia bacterium]
MCQPILETDAPLQERAFDIQPQPTEAETTGTPAAVEVSPGSAPTTSSAETSAEPVSGADETASAASTEVATPKPAAEKRRKPPGGGYKPAQVLQRMKGRSGIYKAYLADSEALLLQIRLLGLGPALALLQAQSENKSQRRVYWDLSQWIFKAQRIRGRNSRSLLDSVVYGDSRFLVKATHAAVQFLEAILQLDQQNAKQSQTRSKSQS